VDGLPRRPRPVHRDELRGPRQASGMGGENPVRAVLHPALSLLDGFGRAVSSISILTVCPRVKPTLISILMDLLKDQRLGRRGFLPSLCSRGARSGARLKSLLM